MISNFYNWEPHIIVDNFLQPDHFKQACEAEIPVAPHSREVIAYGNNHSQDRMNLRHIEFYYHDILMNYLQQLAPEKVKLYDWTNLAINLTGPECKFDIHTDTENKLLSLVVYLTPENSTGTLIYKDSSGKGMDQVTWKPNRAFIFSRNNNTWHSYSGDKIGIRKVLIMNLMSDRV